MKLLGIIEIIVLLLYAIYALSSIISNEGSMLRHVIELILIGVFIVFNIIEIKKY